MVEPQPPEDTEQERRRGNVALLVLFVVVVGIGVWLINALVDARRVDECIAQRRSNCSPVELPPR
jgi:hypothetical protein